MIGPCDLWCAKCKKEKESIRLRSGIEALNKDLKSGVDRASPESEFTKFKNEYVNKPKLKPKVNPLDVEYDDVKLRDLLTIDEERRREGHPRFREAWARPSDIQRAAVSAHWSAQLRAKVAESATPKMTVMMAIDAEDL